MTQTIYIYINPNLKKEAKNDFEKYFFKLINDTAFEKTMENVRKLRDIKLVKTERRRNYFHTTKFFTENLLAIDVNKTETLMNKTVYLELSISKLSKILMYVFCYDYVKPKYDEKAKLLCYIDTDSFILYVKTDDNYKDIKQYVETRFDT